MQTPRICLSPAELEALQGLPYICCVLYIAIRGAMDGASCIAGEMKRISWWQFREACHVEMIPGRHKFGTPSLQTIRLAARSLHRAGLIVFMSDAWARELKFKCPLAPTLSLVQKSLNRPNDPSLNRPLRPTEPPSLNRPQDPSLNRHLCTSLSTKVLSSSCESDVAQATAIDESVERPGTTRLLFNGILNPTQQRRIRDLLLREGLPLQAAQLVVDELHGWLRQAKSTEAPIRNPVGYTKTIIKTSREPGWTPRYAAEVAQERADLSRHPNLPDDPTRANGPARPAAVFWESLPSNIARRVR